MRPVTPILLLVLAACTDYDLVREPKDEPDGPGDTEAVVDPTQPDIEVSPTTLDFGSLMRGCTTDEQVVTVKNVGGATLAISSIALSGSGTSSYTLTATPRDLAPDEELTFTVSFTPQALSTVQVKVVVESNDPDEPSSKVALSGTGAEESLYEESFEQGFFESVDILWVVDNSGSMSGILSQVKTNFQSFIDQFVDMGLDYHLGVITTDMDNPLQSGKLQGPVTYITSEDTDVVGMFTAAVDQGDTGSGKEQGFGAVKAALTDPLLTGYNAGFLREDAALATIVVSDENDDTDALNPGNFSTWYLGLKSDPAELSFSAICGDATWGCSNFDTFPPMQATAGDEYIDAAALTGGVFQSICATNFDEALQHLSVTAAGMQFEFPLTYEPANLGSTTVTVDGIEVGYYDGTTGWKYNADNNSVVFYDEAIPGPGATINVVYPVEGECP